MSYDYEKGLNYALYLLSLQMKTVSQMEEKLASKEMSPEIIRKIIQFLIEHQFLDDANYAQNYIRSRRHKYGDYRIKMDLSRKGVSNADVLLGYQMIADEEGESEPSQEEAVRVVLDKKIATINIDWDRLKSDYKYKYGIYQKLASFLAGRGFSSSVVKSAVSERLAEHFFDE